MKEEILPYISEIRKIVNDFLFPVYFSKIDEHIGFIKSCEAALKDYAKALQIDEGDSHKQKLDYHTNLYSIIQTKYSKTERKNFDNDFGLFIEKINSFLQTIEENIIRIQDEERFIVSEDDGYFLRILKTFKRLFFFISKIPLSTANFFRKLFRKPLKEKNRWTHKIPLRNLVTLFLRDSFSRSTIRVTNGINENISRALLEVWKRDEEVRELKRNEVLKTDFNEIVTELEALKADLIKSIENVFDEKVLGFEDAFKKVGTIELSSGKFNTEKVEKRHDALNEDYKTLDGNWANTFFALFEDWRMNKELYVLREKLYKDYKKLSLKTNDIVENKIKPKFKIIEDFLDEVAQGFNEFSGNSTEAKELLVSEKVRIFNKLSTDIIPLTSELILNQNIPDLIDQIEYQVDTGVKNLPEKRAIVNTSLYNRGIKDSEIDYISPNEIITYSAIPSFVKSSKEVKSDLMLELEEIQKGLKDIAQIADFNIESAISMYQTDKDTLENPVIIAVEGIKRAFSKAETIERKVDDIEVKINKDLNEAVEKINDQLLRLTLNENIIDIKLRIAKTKALQRTKELKQRTFLLIKSFVPQIILFIKKSFNDSKTLFQNFRSKFGLTPPPTSISTEVSDFLAATENAISKLPFVYQRLFRIEALEDERFFEGREKELEGISTAFNNWQRKRYAPVIVFGEKGSGVTTLLNFFFRNLDSDYAITRTSVQTKINTEKNFIDFLKNILKESSVKTHYDVIDYLNENMPKRIIVLENFQNFFLKKVNGFTCLKMLFEIISRTNKNVFWIVTSNLYAWEYLAKVMNVADYFGYQVKVGQLSDKQMIDIILKRHRISGYNIYFKPWNPELIKKKYKKLSEEEIQDVLVKEYFSDLNKFAKSNISLALLFWMRSTQEVSTNLITLSSVSELNTSFLEVINQEKIFILHLLLIHDGLSEEDIASIYNKPSKDVRLVLLALYDDGIIIRKDNLFMINPLLYRQIIFLLQSKNIIH